MALKNYKPTTPGRRQLILVDRSDLWKGKPVKALTEGLSQKGGRNSDGRITMRHRGGGHKRRYRKVDFKRCKFDVPATVERLEYDPNRSAFIALVRYEDGEQGYILAPQRVSPGDTVVSGNRCDIKPGNAMPMSNIPVGTIIHNVEMKPGKGGQIARSAGNYVQLVGKDQGYALLRAAVWRAADGPCPVYGHRRRGLQPGQPEHQSGQRPAACAGRARRPSGAWRRHEPGRPSPRRRRGEVPRAGGIRSPPWGVPTKGKRTRSIKRTDRFIMRRRGKK